MTAGSARRLGHLFGSSQRRQDIITAYLCLLPWMIGFLSFVFGPMIFSLGLSFYESDLLTRNYFVGLANYDELFSDPLFWQSVKVPQYRWAAAWRC
jgi:multiple sugar transport system permease protein